MPRHRLVRAAVCLMLAAGAGLYGATAAAAEPCPEIPPRPPAAPRPDPEAERNLPTELSARELRLEERDVGEFIGDAELTRGGRTLSAERLIFDSDTETADAAGDVVFKDAAGLSYRTEEAHLNLGARTGHAGAGDFVFEDGRARGDAQGIAFEGPDRTRLTRVRYTTCEPGRDDWYLKIRELELDTAEDIGTARHASVNFQGVPLFYLPYLNFPISDERKSGFLAPRLGHASSRGTELSTPYYFNIAPQLDDTVTPTYMSKRGWQLQNEVRYLTPRSHGTLQVEVLPNDKLADGDDRAAGVFRHDHAFSPLWSGYVDVRGISDKDYFEDFRDELGVTSQTHLPQNARVDYLGPRWSFSARATDYQTIDRTIVPVDRPYARLPQLSLSYNRPAGPNRFNYSLDSELASFERDDSINGERLNLNPSVSYPLANSYAFLTPRIGLRHISYRLSNSPDNAPSLTRGLFSLDGGLFFERDSVWSGRRFTQTLEPRLYYLYIPSRNQDALPLFDTSVPDFTFNNLFRDNRFIGGDRIGDANQLTAAVTTRYLDEQDGVERARASLGRIYYFDDREVNLPAGTTVTRASDIVAEVSATLASHWHARASGQWNRENDQTRKYSYYLQYNPARDRIVNIGRRFSRDELEQTDVSLEWPVATRWAVRARALRSQEDHRTLESYAGVEYNACCWALRLQARRRLEIDPLVAGATTEKFSIMLELELSGLSKLGKVTESPLRESVFSFPSATAAPAGSAAP